MIQTISYVYDCGRWVPAPSPQRYYFSPPINGYFQATCAAILWRGEDLASRTIEDLGRILVHDEWI